MAHIITVLTISSGAQKLREMTPATAPAKITLVAWATGPLKVASNSVST